ncbi:hypothetical protein HP398_29575 [Brevibacillus sp. HB1.4B]|uniref:hypothetical protein n=1 Tax=Brevibacillus sp. HB1.4B TaxID=2738845 RepID=UPI00156AB0D4|nr:hypothetical protein [Brevibacillus sp. HB1.4B]NRS20572.1 hypothetical protein [Brevibacillus sp. HB1.4B]
MLIEQVLYFWQEWGALITLLVFVGVLMAADLFPRIMGYIAEVESHFPGMYKYLELKEHAVIDRYDRLPARIRSGFALIGGKNAWARLVKWMYKYLRKRVIKE